MGYIATKVYSDGSHYIGIPPELQQVNRRKKTRHKKKEVLNDNKQVVSAVKSNDCGEVAATADVDTLFETLYKENSDKKRKEKKKIIEEGLKEYFQNEVDLTYYIERELEKKKRNALARKIRLYRKVNLQQWDYFATFTYDSAKITEEDFRKKLSNSLKKLSYRKGWKYVGVWERSPENNRLHFHALIYAPEMVGTFEEKRDYSTKNNRMQTANQNSYFLERFGRNDFKPICPYELSQAVAYLTKYIEKTGERIVYSKGLPTYFVSDIADEDIVCHMGIDDRKILLFDNFMCMDEGVLMGEVSKDVIEKMPKAN